MKDVKKLMKMMLDAKSSFKSMDKVLDRMGMSDGVDSLTDAEIEIVFDLMVRFVKRSNKALKFAEKKGLKREVFQLTEEMVEDN